jgi:hypothetical protein
MELFIMEKTTAILNDRVVYIHHIGKFKEWALVSYTKDEQQMFKCDIADLQGLNESTLNKILVNQELEEQKLKK